MDVAVDVILRRRRAVPCRRHERVSVRTDEQFQEDDEQAGDIRRQMHESVQRGPLVGLNWPRYHWHSNKTVPATGSGSRRRRETSSPYRTVVPTARSNRILYRCGSRANDAPELHKIRRWIRLVSPAFADALEAVGVRHHGTAIDRNV